MVYYCLAFLLHHMKFESFNDHYLIHICLNFVYVYYLFIKFLLA